MKRSPKKMAKKTVKKIIRSGAMHSSLPPAEFSPIDKVTLGGKVFKIIHVSRHSNTGQFIKILEEGGRKGIFIDHTTEDDFGTRKARK